MGTSAIYREQLIHPYPFNIKDQDNMSRCATPKMDQLRGTVSRNWGYIIFAIYFLSFAGPDYIIRFLI